MYALCREGIRMNNPYEVLGVSPLDTLSEIKDKYRKLCKKYHPDIAGEEFTAKFQEINDAWEYLKANTKEDKPKQYWSHKTLFTVERRSL